MYYTYFEDTCYFYSNFLLNVKVAKSLESAYAWSRSLLCRIVVKLHFQLFNNVDLFSHWGPIHKKTWAKKSVERMACLELAAELLFSTSKTEGQFD